MMTLGHQKVMALLRVYLILGAYILFLDGYLQNLLKDKAQTKANVVSHNMCNAAEVTTGNASNSSSLVNATTVLERNVTDKWSSLDTAAPNVAPGNDTFLAKLASTEPCLWLYVSSWDEGMSNWIKSLAEILIVAKTLQAVFVEPCISKAGRLVSCGDQPNLLRLQDVFDLDAIRQFHSRVVSFDEFNTICLTNKNVHLSRICMHMGKPVTACGELESQARKKTSPELEQALLASKNMHAVLEVTYFRKEAFGAMHYNGCALVQESIPTIVEQYVRFRQEHYDAVGRFLNQMGVVQQPFAVIQWRAELKDMDYMGCAAHLLEARTAMNLPNETVFVLMSSLNTQKDLQWGPLQSTIRNTAAPQALHLLLDSGFLKLDAMSQQTHHDELILLAVWDQILAVKATYFATCSGCRSICAQCNWQGGFARLALDLRTRANKESFKCWPEPGN